jgi:hypothetical protein
MEKIWKEHVPWLKFEYNFLDEKFASTFEREERLSSIFSIFTVLARLPWLIWSSRLYCRTENKGDWNPESNGGNLKQCYKHVE